MFSQKNEKNEDFIHNVINISIPSFTEKYINNKTITFYTINIINNINQKTWSIDKRYSDFESLYKTLKKTISNLPSFPGKTLFRPKSKESVTKRKNHLEQFIQTSITRKDIFNNELFSSFLNINENSPELLINKPSLLYTNDSIPFGIRDLYYIEQTQTLFICCSEMSFVSRADSMIANLTLPWEQASDSHITVGAFICYNVSRSDDEENLYEFNRTYSKSFPVQTSVLNWDNESNTLSVGLYNGSIAFLKYVSDSNIEELIEIKPHSNRIMGIAFDVKTGYVYSCSLDRTFIVSDINYQSNVTEISRCGCGYTALYYDKVNSRILLANEVGVLTIYNTSKYPPVEITNIELSSYESIRDICVNYDEKIMLLVNTGGKICICDFRESGKEKYMTETACFGGKDKLKTLIYDNKANEIITGDENGRVIVWSVKEEVEITSWTAHDEGITRMYYNEESRMLWTGGKDKLIRIWKLPEKWVKEEVVEFEKFGKKKLNDVIAENKMKEVIQMQMEGDESDSDLDDLNGWDFSEEEEEEEEENKEDDDKEEK